MWKEPHGPNATCESIYSFLVKQTYGLCGTSGPSQSDGLTKTRLDWYMCWDYACKGKMGNVDFSSLLNFWKEKNFNPPASVIVARYLVPFKLCLDALQSDFQIPTSREWYCIVPSYLQTKLWCNSDSSTQITHSNTASTHNLEPLMLQKILFTRTAHLHPFDVGCRDVWHALWCWLARLQNKMWWIDQRV